MQYRIILNEQQTEDIVISARSDGSLLRAIEDLLLQQTHTVMGRTEQTVVPLNSKDVHCFYIENGKVFAQTNKDIYQIRERLYQLEHIMPEQFLKINQSCLINVSQIQRFEASLGGSLTVILKNGYRDYISRRQLKFVKERFGL